MLFRSSDRAEPMSRALTSPARRRTSSAPSTGYEDKIVMAAGAFVQGSSIELSPDGPIREPYNVYFQGGLTYEHSKFGVIKALQAMLDAGLLDL